MTDDSLLDTMAPFLVGSTTLILIRVDHCRRHVP